MIAVDCKMSQWSNCTDTCGTGSRNRSVLIEAELGGQPCGQLLEACNLDPCKGKNILEKIVFKSKFSPRIQLLKSNFYVESASPVLK